MKVLVANRGEIARRILRTCHAMGHATVAVHSEADADAPFVVEADEAVCIGPAASAESYLVIDAILDAARRTSADAIHPGYGFLAENASFAQACEDGDIIFVGPSADSIRKMGSKIEAKRLMSTHGVPVIPGYDGAEQSDEVLQAQALEVGFPLLLKASAGGGGKGMRIVRAEEDLAAALAAARREAASAFGDETLLIERYIERPRHIEFQIIGDGTGKVLHVFERECSIQRRHQKIIEETPSVVLEANPELRERMAAAAVAAGEALDYRSAGTVEFIVDQDLDFYFLEVNTRLQVEHPVTEETTGIDLVRVQLEIAAGAPLAHEQDDVRQCGHSIECRIYAEDPANDFLPSTGRLVDWHVPSDATGVRLDSGVEPGSVVSVHYDPMLAKLVTTAGSRAEATRRMIRVLDQSSIQGVVTNRAFLRDVLASEAWRSGALDTHFVDRHDELLVHDVAAPLRETAAIAATLADVLHRQAAGPPTGPALRPGWRNNRWRDQRARWTHTSRAGDDASDALEIRYRALDRGGRFVVTPGTDAELDRAFAAWLRGRYGSDDALREAWEQERRQGLDDDESLETRIARISEPLLATGKRSDQRREDTRAFRPTVERAVRACLLDDVTVQLTIDGHTTRWRVVTDDDTSYVHGCGESLALARVPELPDVVDEAAAAGAVAPMPGKILQVLVAAGDEVEAGQPLVILEAMKMESTVHADRDGTVAEIFVAVGDQVEADTLLVELTEDE